jgi:TP53 regulating kinase-like protein
VLDKRLTKARLLAEARVLVRCKRDGVMVPGVLGADWEAGWLVLEWVEGRTVRAVLDGWAERVKGEEGADDKGMVDLMGRVGRAVGKLHEIGVCHGDLTTSNLMLRQPERRESQVQAPRSRGRLTTSQMRMIAEDGGFPAFPSVEAQAQEGGDELDGDIVLIDFGLASHSTQNLQDEDRAVDLYVLERAFAATHPAAEPLFKEVLKAYGESFKGARAVLKRLEDVRLRGRKRSMLG